MHKPLLVPASLVDDNVDRLVRLRERPLEHIVVVRRQHQLTAYFTALLAQHARQPSEEAMQLIRGVVAAEHPVQLIHQRPRAADEVHPLRNAEQVELGLRVAVRPRQVCRQLCAARQVAVLPARIRWTLA